MNRTKELEKIEKRMNEIIQERAAEVSALEEKIAQEQANFSEAEEAAAAAGATADLETFRAARNRSRDAQDAIDLYNIRIKAIKDMADMPEAESDKVIDTLLEIQDEHDTEFNRAAVKIIEDLRGLVTRYQEINDRIENDLKNWHEKVKPNRRPEGKGNHNGHAVPVHATKHESWHANKLAFLLSNYDNAARFYESANRS